MLVHQAYRFEMDPNNTTRSALASHAGAARFAYNWGLDLVINRLSARRALVVLAIRSGASRVEAEAWADDLLGPLPWTLPALRRAWNQAKAEVAPWWAENSKESYNSGLDALARALDAWSKSRRGRRKGRAVGFPRFKTKSTARRSFRVTTGASGWSTTATSACPASASSAPRSRRPSRKPPSGLGPPASCRPRSPSTRGAGTWPLGSRSPGPSIGHRLAHPLAWTWA